MQNGMITTPLTPHNGPYFVPTTNNLTPPSKSGKPRPDSLAARFADWGWGGVATP